MSSMMQTALTSVYHFSNKDFPYFPCRLLLSFFSLIQSLLFFIDFPRGTLALSLKGMIDKTGLKYEIYFVDFHNLLCVSFGTDKATDCDGYYILTIINCQNNILI